MDHNQEDALVFRGDGKAAARSGRATCSTALPLVRRTGPGRSFDHRKSWMRYRWVPSGLAAFGRCRRYQGRRRRDLRACRWQGLRRGAAAEWLLAGPADGLLIPMPPQVNGEAVALYDALADETLAGGLLAMIAGGGSATGTAGQLVAWAGGHFAALRGDPQSVLKVAAIKSEQSNSSIVFGDRLILKLFRRLEDGPNPELEISSYLAEHTSFAHVPPLAGAIEYRRAGQRAGAVAVLQGFVTNQGDAWQLTLGQLAPYFDRVLVCSPAEAPPSTLTPRVPPARLLDEPIPAFAHERIGPVLASAALLARRTAEMHLALAAGALYRGLLARALRRGRSPQRSIGEVWPAWPRGRRWFPVRERLNHLPQQVQSMAQRLLELEPVILERFAALQRTQFSALRIRCHGDYHLGQVLFTGSDFMILDFEGEPARLLAERASSGRR